MCSRSTFFEVTLGPEEGRPWMTFLSRSNEGRRFFQFAIENFKRRSLVSCPLKLHLNVNLMTAYISMCQYDIVVLVGNMFSVFHWVFIYSIPRLHILFQTIYMCCCNNASPKFFLVIYHDQSLLTMINLQILSWKITNNYITLHCIMEQDQYIRCDPP